MRSAPDSTPTCAPDSFRPPAIALDSRGVRTKAFGNWLVAEELAAAPGFRALRRPHVPTPTHRAIQRVAVGIGVSRPGHVRAIARAGADGVLVASALADALGPDGRDVVGLTRLVRDLRAST